MVADFDRHGLDWAFLLRVGRARPLAGQIDIAPLLAKGSPDGAAALNRGLGGPMLPAMSDETGPDATQESLAGRLLVAMPGLEDPRFERAVMILCQHDAEHAMGLAINRPIEGLSVSRLLSKLAVNTGSRPLDDLVLLGGPVETERGFVLHTDDYDGPGGRLPIPGGLALTLTREILEAVAADSPHPRRAAMALGYAGWDSGQLEAELLANYWLTCEADEALLFDDDHAHKWSRALAKIGVSAENLSAQAGRA